MNPGSERLSNEMIVIETERLVLRRIVVDDAAFMFELMNDPSWLTYIGDRGIRTIEDARENIRKGPISMYERHGFGLYLVIAKASGASIGICGPLKRDALTEVDLGFAFLPAYSGKGYAAEAATGVIKFVRDTLGIKRLIAITNPANERSIRLLERLGFVYERETKLSPAASLVRVYGVELKRASGLNV